MRNFVNVTKRLDEFSVVSDDDKHEILLFHSFLDNFPKRTAQTPDIFAIQICRRLV